MSSPLDDLAAFAVVARERSFTRAAAELRVSTSALSHRIKAMESRLGVRLLQRNSRSVAPTAAGTELLQTLEPALARIDEALGALGSASDVVSGTVRITATRHAYETVVRPVLPGFTARHPKATVEVLIDYRLRDIIAERLDAGIRLGENLEQDMIAVRVGPDLRMVVVAAADYLDRAPPIETPQDLMKHRCINYRLLAAGSLYAWEFERDGRRLEVKVDGPLTFNEPALMIDAAVDGLGIAYVLEGQVAPHLAAGRLVRLLDGWMPLFQGYFLYYPSRRQGTPVLKALVDALRARQEPAP